MTLGVLLGPGYYVLSSGCSALGPGCSVPWGFSLQRVGAEAMLRCR